jgi:hypothetical protein
MNGDTASEAERPEPADSGSARNFLIIAIALLLLKLLLVSQREIVPEEHDASEYAQASLEGLRAIFAGGTSHPPGASLAIVLARSIGIPYRVFMEVFLAVAAFLFFRPLVVSMRLGVAGVAFSFGLLLFHPALILGLDRVMSDSVGFFCWLAGVGGIIGFVAASQEKLSWGNLGLVIAGFAFAGITRSGEGVIVLVEMVAVALLSVFMFRGVDGWRRRRAVVACLFAVVANCGATQALSAWHFAHVGYWGATAVESHEWWQLYSVLLSLPVERNNRHALINKSTMEMAESLSEDLHNLSPCFEEAAAAVHQIEEPQNDVAAWRVTICLSEYGSQNNYAKLRTISSDIVKGAQENHLQLTAPILGVIPQPATRWLSELPLSAVKLALEAVQIPSSTRVAQNDYNKELFSRALLRRTALVAEDQNPEVFGFQAFIRRLYTVLSSLFWPSVPLVFLILAGVAIRASKTGITITLAAFTLSIMIIDVLCRISFYSVVDWILWDIQLRYILGTSVLTVVIVATLVMVWLVPAAAGALRPRLMKLPGLPAWAENLTYRRRRA